MLNVAQAASLKFKFDINSSGTSIYACDAGLRHPVHAQQICYHKETLNLCTPGPECLQGECNCVCTGGLNNTDGQHRFDSMNVSFANWSDNGSSLPTQSSLSIAAGTSAFARVFSANNEWGKQLTDLEYNLSSELYGAEMYLDVCYRGSQIEHYENSLTHPGASSDTPNHQFDAQVTITDLTTGVAKYSTNANLKVKAKVICDLQGKGSYLYARNLSNDYDTTDSQLTNTLTGGDSLATSSLNAETPYVTFNSTNLSLLSGWLNVNSYFSPRFCKVRYTFKEFSGEDSDIIKRIRKWQLQKARVCTYTSINEPLN
jgi:hypothetical protein